MELCIWTDFLAAKENAKWVPNNLKRGGRTDPTEEH